MAKPPLGVRRGDTEPEIPRRSAVNRLRQPVGIGDDWIMLNTFFCRATKTERAVALPGDEDIPDPVAVLDHAIDVTAPPGAVWPWLAQMGAWPKAGWYSYDFLDNRGHSSLDRVDPGLTQIGIGSVFPALPEVTDCFILTALEENRFQLLAMPGPDGPQGEPGSDNWRRSFSRSNWTWH